MELAPVAAAPRVSVVVVSQNQSQLLRPTLASLAARSEPELSEVIVVDCGSRDGSARLDEEFEGITLLRLPRNFGLTRAVNIATRTAKGDYLFLLPNGCAVEPDTIQRLVAALEAAPDAGAVTAAGEVYALPKSGDKTLRAVAAKDAEYPHDQPVLFPKLALVSMNYLPDKYGQFYGDAELFQKMRSAGKRVLVLEDLEIRRERAPMESFDADLAAADRVNGLSTFYSRNYGFASGTGFWLAESAKALFGFKFGLAVKLLSGSKVDGL